MADGDVRKGESRWKLEEHLAKTVMFVDQVGPLADAIDARIRRLSGVDLTWEQADQIANAEARAVDAEKLVKERDSQLAFVQNDRDILKQANDLWQIVHDGNVAAANKRTDAAEARIANLIAELAAADKRADAKRIALEKELGDLKALVRDAYVKGGPGCGLDHYIIAKGSWERLVWAVWTPEPKPRWSCTCTHAPEQHGKYGCLVTKFPFAQPCSCITRRPA